MQLVKKLKGLDIALNAHRWKKAKFSEKISKTLIGQFNYQGKKITRLDLIFDDRNRITSSNIREITVSYKLKGDPELESKVTEFRENVNLAKNKKAKLDLYTMSYCPYGTRATTNLLPLMDRFGENVDLNIYYIVSRRDGKFTSLHGREELDENLRQICIKLINKEKLFDYILCINNSEDIKDWKRCTKKIEIDPLKVEECTKSEEARNELNIHYQRKKRLHVESSPTIYINNRKFSEGLHNELSLRKHICELLPNIRDFEVCQNLPECFSDKDCWKTGYIGKCKDADTPQGKCVYEKDEEFTFTVITTKSALMSNETDIIDSTRSIFPGMKLKIPIEEKTDSGARTDSEAGKSSTEKKYKEIIYRVKRGDNLYKIARMFYKSSKAWKKIAEINNIEEPGRIFIGMELKIPVEEVTVRTLKKEKEFYYEIRVIDSNDQESISMPAIVNFDTSLIEK